MWPRHGKQLESPLDLGQTAVESLWPGGRGRAVGKTRSSAVVWRPGAVKSGGGGEGAISQPPSVGEPTDTSHGLPITSPNPQFKREQFTLAPCLTDSIMLSSLITPHRAGGRMAGRAKVSCSVQPVLSRPRAGTTHHL